MLAVLGRGVLQLDALRIGFLAADQSPLDVTGGDADFVLSAQQGDAAAFTLLYRRYAPRIYDYAYRRLGERESAEDATQIVFLRVATSLAGCRDPNAPKPAQEAPPPPIDLEQADVPKDND